MDGRVKYYDPIIPKKFGSKTRVCCFSDTHNLHAQAEVPECDVLVCAGDFSSRGESNRVLSFLHWFEAQPASYKLYIAGNHDVSFQSKPDFKSLMLNTHPRLIYLEDTGVKINGLTFWGSPFQPQFGVGWAFNEPRGAAIRRHWDLIPQETDVLITHGPAYGVLDNVSWTGEKVGCCDLLSAVKKLNGLRLHLAGHIHREKGAARELAVGKTVCANVSICDDSYRVVNQPLVFDL